MVSQYKSVKTCDPIDRAILALGESFNELGIGPLGDATYQISRLYALWFQTRDFFHVFPNKAYVKHVTTGRVHFGPRDIILTNMLGQLADATFQISRL